MHPARLHLEALHGDLAPEPDITRPVRESPTRAKAIDRICVASTRSILVVDDNERHLDILSAILSSVGHEVETCASGAEALQRLATRRYDVAILDLVMPEIGGVAVAEQMRAGVLNAATPIIVCTANVVIARRQLASLQGLAAIIGKPIDTASLILAVARAPDCMREPAVVRH